MTIIDTNTIIEKLELKIEIMHAIKTFQRRIASLTDSIENYKVHFPSLAEKYRHEVDICERCIVRLLQRYDAVQDNPRIARLETAIRNLVDPSDDPLPFDGAWKEALDSLTCTPHGFE
jgi:hypothetical protein